MIQDTVHGLNVHLQRVDERLEDFPVSTSSTPGIDLTNEKEVTKQCLRICEDAKHYLESTRKSSVLEVPSATDDQHHDSFPAQLLARQALDEHRNSFANIIGQIRNRLESLVLENNPDFTVTCRFHTDWLNCRPPARTVRTTMKHNNSL